MRLAHKVVVVTGASGGQGANHARRMCQEGAAVLLTDIDDAVGDQLAQRLSADGHRAAYQHLDVSSQEDWRRAADVANSRFGGIDVLVNNAGISSRAHIADCTTTQWNTALAVNLTGMLLGIQAVLPSMRQAGAGSIINVSSLWAHTGGIPAGSVGYVASKAGVLGLTRNAALTLAPDGIRVNSISPGYIDILMKGPPDPSVADALVRTPLGRLGTLDEITGIVIHLASDESGFTTGVDIPLDGGLHLG